jgi:AbrB family looped-hinge helix DNA binding protein
VETTILSSRGQVVIPKGLREARHWPPGTSFYIEEVAQGILLKPMRTFAAAQLSEVMGSAGYSGPALTQQAIDAALQADVINQYPQAAK